jgi:hypothetical protein
MEQKKLIKPREKISLEESNLSVSVSALVIKKGQSGNDMITIYPHKIGPSLTQKNGVKATIAFEPELAHSIASFIIRLCYIPSSVAHYVPDIWRKALDSLYVLSLEKQYQISSSAIEEAAVGAIMEGR